jgi:UDP-2-acetamido-3-amino-2,3-dideoxy-glucuronate N-acetyltransferase
MAGANSKKAASIAVIGSGYWGKNLVRNFNQLGALKHSCDKNENIVNRLKKQYTDIETCLELEEVLCRGDIKALVVATPAEYHFEVARKALLSGKNVFVEKPLSLTEKESRDLVKLAERNELIPMVEHILQYYPVGLSYRKKLQYRPECRYRK